MRNPRFFLNSMLGVVIAAAACSNEQVAPSFDLAKAVKPPKVAVCDPLKPVTTSALFGPAGGTLKVGPHRLVIPAGALADTVTISGSISGAAVDAIQFAPEGLHFNVGATLTMGTESCKTLDQPTTVIVYTDDALNILETIAVSASTSKTVSGTLWHFSQYAVAY